MRSVKTKLFLNISFLVIFFALLSWGLSALFLNKFYIWHKQKSVIDSARHINDLYAASPQNISSELEKTANSLGASIIILGPNGDIKASSLERILNKNFMHPPHPEDAKQPPPFVAITRYELDNNTILEFEQDQTLNISFMVLKRLLPNADLLIIKLPLAAVSESASYAMNFFIITGLLTILAGCAWAYFFAKKFTLPLRELSVVAQSIASLDFSRKCTIASQDEIGDLGRSINNLSSRLDKAISELNHQNRQLQADVEEERRLDKLRKNFISSVSHELKTPISLILGYAEGLQENVNKDEENKNYYCAVIMDEAAKMDKLVQDLLNLTQIESGFYVLDKTDFDLSVLLAEVLLKYRAILQEKNIRLELTKPPNAMVNADRMRIEQILVNYLNNAIDHVDDRKIISISICGAAEKTRLCVYNSGRHIPADSIDNLWLSFYKVDTARTRSLGGHGLGLSIVRAIQELHQNSYGVRNAENGVIFWADLSAC